MLPRVAVFLWLQVATTGTGAIDTSKIRLVDYDNNTGHWLFRGGDPTSGKGSPIAMQHLARAFTSEAAKVNLSFPSEFFLRDLSLEYEGWESVMPFLADNPDLGDFVWWPLGGLKKPQVAVGCYVAGVPIDGDSPHCAVQLRDMTAADVARLAAQPAYGVWADGNSSTPMQARAGGQVGMPSDYLSSRVLAVREFLQNPPPPAAKGRPLVLYAHCAAGYDRTGEFIAAYTMTYLGWNFTKSIEWSRSICGNPPVYWNMLAAQWYCASLYEASQHLRPSDCANCEAFYPNCEPPPAAQIVVGDEGRDGWAR
jgi:hypothetical protein